MATLDQNLRSVQSMAEFKDSHSDQWRHGEKLDGQSKPDGGGPVTAVSMLQALPAAIYTTDAKGKITFYNEAAVELWGVRPKLSHDEFCGSWKLYWPNGTFLPHDQCPMAEALREAKPIRGKEAVAERPDGTRVPFLAYPTPLFDDDGKLAGAINMLVDISGRKEAELAAQKLAAIVESSHDAILSTDLEGIITSWNRGAQQLFGYTPCEVLGRSVSMLIPDDRQHEEPRILARVRVGERIEHLETMRKRKDGSLFDVSLSVSPIMDETGLIVGASKIARDISDRRRAEEQKDLLLREMDHRVKNLFALANGVVGMTGRKVTSIAALVSDVQERFGALSRAHSLTMPRVQEQKPEQIPTLHALISKVMEPYSGEQAEQRVIVTGSDTPIGPATVTNFALILHELATNALKYGALSCAVGKVRIDCAAEAESFYVTWHEDTELARHSEPLREGFGSRLARNTVEGPLGGSFAREFTKNGVRIELRLAQLRLID